MERDGGRFGLWLLAANYYSLFNSEIRDSHREVMGAWGGSLACPLAPHPVISESWTLLLMVFTIVFTMYLDSFPLALPVEGLAMGGGGGPGGRLVISYRSLSRRQVEMRRS